MSNQSSQVLVLDVLVKITSIYTKLVENTKIIWINQTIDNKIRDKFNKAGISLKTIHLD